MGGGELFLELADRDSPGVAFAARLTGLDQDKAALATMAMLKAFVTEEGLTGQRQSWNAARA